MKVKCNSTTIVLYKGCNISVFIFLRFLVSVRRVKTMLVLKHNRCRLKSARFDRCAVILQPDSLLRGQYYSEKDFVLSSSILVRLDSGVSRHTNVYPFFDEGIRGLDHA